MGIGSAISKVFSLGSFVLSNTWLRVISISFLLIFITLSGAIIASVNQRSLDPFVKEVGYSVTRQSVIIYENVNHLTGESNLGYTRIRAWLNIITALWMLYFVFKVVRLPFAWLNDSEKTYSAIIALIIIIGIQYHYVKVEGYDIGVTGGIRHLIENADNITNGRVAGWIKESFVNADDSAMINITSDIANKSNISSYMGVG